MRLLLEGHRLARVASLEEGDACDLAGDVYADPGEDEHSTYHYEYAVVAQLERETPNCVCVFFEDSTVGFPPDHLVIVRVDEGEP